MTKNELETAGRIAKEFAQIWLQQGNGLYGIHPIADEKPSVHMSQKEFEKWFGKSEVIDRETELNRYKEIEIDGVVYFCIVREGE